MQDESEVLDIPKWLKTLLMCISLTSVAISLIIYVAYFFDSSLPVPSDVEASYLLSLGIAIPLFLHVPWQRISFGGIEVERALQEQAQDYSEVISKLEGDVEVLLAKLHSEEDLVGSNKAAVDNSDHTAHFNPKQQVSSDLQHNKNQFGYSRSELKRELSDELKKFLEEYGNWGFTPSRIKNWGGEKSQYNIFQEVSISEIRLVLDLLVESRHVKTRVSKNGNLLYQINK